MIPIKIGARVFSVEKKDLKELSKEQGAEIQGYVDYFQSKIVLNDNLSPDAEEEVLVHEILHTILDRKNLEVLAKKSDMKELVENMVEYITPRFHSFLRDNPELLKHFLDKA